MDLFFEIQSGSAFSIEVGYWDTVLEIKQKIEKYRRIPVSEQTLFFQGDVLEDDLDIEQCNIFHNSRLRVVVSPSHKASDQVLQTKKSPVSSDSTGDIIYGQDLPLTTQHFMDIQALRPVTTEEITPVMAGSNKNSDQVLQTEKSPPLKPAEQVIDDQDSPVTAQALQTNKSPLSKSATKIIISQDSPGEGKSPRIMKILRRNRNNNNDQVLQAEQSPPSNSIKETSSSQDPPWKPVKVKPIPMRMTVYVLPYSGESKAASKIPVDVKPMDNVGSLRKELVKIQEKGQLNLPEEGYFFKHKQSKMVEDQAFWWSGVDAGDTIEISPGHLHRGSVTHSS